MFMNKPQLTVAQVIGLVIVLFLSGCVTTPSQDKSSKNDSGNVRVSGDVTVSTINRKGF